MTDDDSLSRLLDLYQSCKSKGERASLFLETKNGMQSFTFTINSSTGGPAERSSLNRRRWKSPSQLKRDNKRRHEFLAKKLESQPAAQENEVVEGKIDKVFLEELNDEIDWRFVKNFIL